MGRQLRSLLYFIFFIVLIVALLPFASGIFFKQKYLELIRALNAESEIQLTVREYHLGWLHSEALLDISLKKPFFNAQPTGLTLEQHIQHGPVIFAKNQEGTRFAYAVIDGNLKKDSVTILHIQTESSFTGDFQSQILVPPKEFAKPLLGKLTWQGLSGTMDLKAEKNVISDAKFAIQIGSIEANSLMGTLNVSSGTLQNEVHYTNNASFAGTQILQIPAMLIDILDYDVRVASLKMQHAFHVTNNNYSSVFDISLQQLTIPNLILSPVNITLNINNVNFKAFQHDTLLSEKDITYPLLLQSFTPQTQWSGTLDVAMHEGKLNVNFKGSWPEKAFPLQNDAFTRMNYEIKIMVSKTLIDHLIELMPENTEKSAEKSPAILFENKISELVEQKQVSIYAASQIKEIVKKPLTFAAFVTLIERLESTKEILPAAILPLKQYYTLSQATPAVISPEPTPKEMMHAKVEDLIKQGYIIEDKDNYIVNIVNKDDVLLINGKTATNLSDIYFKNGYNATPSAQ